MRLFRKILIPVDFSDYCKRAIAECATLFAGDEPMDFYFVHVWRLPAEYVDWADDPGPEMLEKLRSFVGEFPHAGQHTTHFVLLTGHPATALCKLAKEHEFDLIALATHGRTGLAHLLIGSTAEQIVRHAACPVLTLRLP